MPTETSFLEKPQGVKTLKLPNITLRKALKGILAQRRVIGFLKIFIFFFNCTSLTRILETNCSSKQLRRFSHGYRDIYQAGWLYSRGKLRLFFLLTFLFSSILIAFHCKLSVCFSFYIYYVCYVTNEYFSGMDL